MAYTQPGAELINLGDLFMEAFVGTIMPWPIPYAPRGWAFCDGRLLPISQNTVLFALISTLYGGDGHSTFGLPDLRGRTVLGANGQLPLTNRQLASKGGAETQAVSGTALGQVTLTESNLPAHTHPATLSLTGLSAKTTISVGTGTGGQLLATELCTLTSTASGAPGAAIYQLASVAPVTPVTLGGVSTTVDATGGTVTVGSTGNNVPVPLSVAVNLPVATLPPFLTLNYIICLEGLYPSRN